MRCDKVVVESDSKGAVQLITEEEDVCHPPGAVIDGINQLKSSFLLCNICHVPRERNRLTHELAALNCPTVLSERFWYRAVPLCIN
ncbi:hypothetical protein SLA2020_205720 [Shorea laevis]